MSVHNYIRVAAHFRAPGAGCAVGVLYGRLSWQLESSLCPFDSLSCSPALLSQQQSRCYSPSPVWICPLLLVWVTSKKHFCELTTELRAWHMFLNAFDILWEPMFKVLCVFFNSLAIVLDLIFCLRKRACMVHCPWGRVYACSNAWMDVSIFLKLCTSIMHTANV